MHVFHATDDVGCVQQAVQAYRDRSAPPIPFRRSCLRVSDNLGTSLAERYDKAGDLDDLHESVALHERALSLLPPPSEVRVGILNNLAVRVAQRAATPAAAGRAAGRCSGRRAPKDSTSASQRP